VPEGDILVPLCTYAQFTEGAYADLVAGFSPAAVNDILVEATRQCEDQTGRRLAPFTVTETGRVSGIDPSEYATSTGMPVSIQGTLGMSEAAALSVTNLVRHHWLREFPPRYQDLWAYSGVTVKILRSFGGSQTLGTGQILSGPDDLGHIWFTLGQFIPVASYAQITYSGGYTVATPASLLRASKFLAASIAIDELNPEDNERDPDRLYNLALRWLAPYAREGSPLAGVRARA
jgi:hypothetical protein